MTTITITKYGDADTEGTFDGTAQRQTLVGKAGAGFENVLYGEALELKDVAKGGNDMLIGGEVAYRNSLFGDAVYMEASQGGNDTLIGGTGATTNELYGDAAFMYGGSTGGDDKLTGGAGATTNKLYGDAAFMSQVSTGGDDKLTGGAGATTNKLYGDAYRMDDDSTGGDDKLTGGADATTNELYGDAYRMDDGSTGGDDKLTGGAGATNNYLYGDAQYKGDGTVTCGNDRLISGTGNDDMWGDIAYASGGINGQETDLVLDETFITGHDVFVFSANNGTDTIHDFRKNEDTIELHKMDVADFGALQTGGYLKATDTNTVITFGTNTITILGVTGLTADDFLFT